MPNQYTKKKSQQKKQPRKTVVNFVEPKDLPPDVFAALTSFLGELKPSVNPCTKKALDHNLPHFTLLPGDNFTTHLIGEWIRLAVQHGTSVEKIQDARALLKRIEDWRTAHPFACKTPD